MSDTYNQNFEIAILFSVVERSGNSVFKDDTPTHTHRALSTRVGYALRAYKVFMERVVVKIAEGAHWIGVKML